LKQELLTPGLSAELACILEATARKAGNVSRFRDFEDSSYLDFLFAAAAIGRALDGAAGKGVGQAVLDCVEATRELTGTNANLGLILLLAPLAAAASAERPVRPERVEELLQRLTPADGEKVYAAIRLAAPGGLGTVSEEDVASGPPARPLVAAMALAADRDLVARQYSNGFRQVFGEGLFLLEKDLKARTPLEPAIVRSHLQFMAIHPDSLIARKCGLPTARGASERARAVLSMDWPDSEESQTAFRELDHWLRSDGHRRNPGTSADLVGASLFLAITNGIIPLPLSQKAWPWKSIGSG
jgi:triphosphoribosyl-dephospho-CoA synthase